MDATEKLLAALEEATRAEVDGHHFYMMAAKFTEDPKGREVFERLAQDEVDHARYLQAHYESVKMTGKINPDVKLGDPTSYEWEHPIFSPALKERIRDAHYEMSALSIGAQLELNAVEFYKGQAEVAVEAEVKELFTKLADWESRHYHALLKQQDALKGQYWSAGRFSPF